MLFLHIFIKQNCATSIIYLALFHPPNHTYTIQIYISRNTTLLSKSAEYIVSILRDPNLPT